MNFKINSIYTDDYLVYSGAVLIGRKINGYDVNVTIYENGIEKHTNIYLMQEKYPTIKDVEKELKNIFNYGGE